MNVANVGIATIDANGRFLSINHQWQKILGYTADELKRLSTLDITHPDDLEISEKLFYELKSGIIDRYSLEKRYLKKDGSIAWVHLSASVTKDANGVIKDNLGVIVDITEKKQNELTIRDQNEVLK